MRTKRHLAAMAVGAGIVWFTHPTEGHRRREEARRWLDGAEATCRRLLEGSPPSEAATRGATTLTEIVDAAKRSGYASDFATTPEAKVQCAECGQASEPAGMARSWIHRLEGASDPDDLVAVSALRCPSCGAKGLLVLPYGPGADDVEADVSRHLPAPENADMAPLRDLRVAV